MSSFNKKITTHTNKNKINAHSQKKDFDQKKKKITRGVQQQT